MRLLDSAAALLNAKGVSQTSLIELADAHGLSRTALYYYFEDREDLVLQCYLRAGQLMLGRLDDAMQAGGGAEQIVARFVSTMLAEDVPEIAAQSETGFLRDKRRQIISALHEKTIDRLAAIVRSGTSSGRFRDLDSDVAARTIIGVVSWIPLAGYWSGGAASAPRASLAAEVVDFLLNGWAADRQRPIRMAPANLAPLLARPIRAFDREALREAKRETILATASRLFSRNGVDTTSIEQIATELGVTKRTLYRQIGDKQTLLTACYRRAYRISMHMLAQAEGLPGPRSDALASLFRDVALAQLSPELEPLRPMAGYHAMPAEAQAEVDHDAIELTNAFVRLFRSAIDDGSVRDIRMEAVRQAVPGATGWLSKESGSLTEPQRGSMADEIARLLCLGLRSTN
jgi:AcrR family transcriptional regulator